MYRHEGMKNNPYHDETGRVPDEHNAEFQDWEAGATAMLEGLKGNGTKLDKGDTFSSINRHEVVKAGVPGHLVFIPEEINAIK